MRLRLQPDSEIRKLHVTVIASASEAIQSRRESEGWIASSQVLLAMTEQTPSLIDDLHRRRNLANVASISSSLAKQVARTSAAISGSGLRVRLVGTRLAVDDDFAVNPPDELSEFHSLASPAYRT